MIRQTGGSASGAIATRCSPAASACAIAAAIATMPSCSPSTPTKRISGALISPLIRCALSWAIGILHKDKSSAVPPTAHLTSAILRARRRLGFKAIDEGIQRPRPEIPASPAPHGHLLRLQLLVAQDPLIRQLLQAMFANFIGNFL